MPSHLQHSPNSAKISCWQRWYSTAFTPRGHRMSRLSRPICSLGAQLRGIPGIPESKGAASSASLLPALATDSAGPPNTLAMRAGDATHTTHSSAHCLLPHAHVLESHCKSETTPPHRYLSTSHMKAASIRLHISGCIFHAASGSRQHANQSSAMLSDTKS